MTTLAPEVLDTPAVNPADAVKRTLNAVDRCDRCGAQAYIQVIVPLLDKGYNGELLMCNHHGQEQRATFEAKGYAFYDHSHLINKKAGASA